MQRKIAEKLEDDSVVKMIRNEEKQDKYGLGRYAKDLAEATKELREIADPKTNSDKINNYLVKATELLVDAAYNFSGKISQLYTAGFVKQLDDLPSQSFGADEVPKIDSAEACAKGEILLAHLKRYQTLAVEGWLVSAAEKVIGKDQKAKQEGTKARAVLLEARIKAFGLAPKEVSGLRRNSLINNAFPKEESSSKNVARATPRH